MKCLFWNVYKNKNINDILSQVILEKDIDVISLAEYEDSLDELINKLRVKGMNYYEVISIGCRRIHIISKCKSSNIEPLPESSYYTMKLIPHKKLQSIIMVFVHFQSNMYNEDEDKLDQARELRNDIERIENLLNIKRTVIIGDFNMNPFEAGMVASNGLHSIPWAKKAQSIKRVVRNNDCYYFYNPMWNLFGDFTLPVGSYYYQASNAKCYFWNIYDQICLRPELIEFFNIESLEFLTEIGSTKLLKNDIPNKEISDHLPLYFEL